MTELIIFYVFAAITVLAATLVVTVRNPVQAALYLVLAFFASAGIWMLLELFKGLSVTGRHLFSRKVTVQYP